MIGSAKLWLLAPAGLALLCSGAQAESVGTVGAVNQSARGTPPGQSARQLSLGLGVENRERIETSNVGSAQIVFRDTSTMTIGRGSAVTVDRFVYDGSADGARQGVSLAKGVLRFVGGGVSHGAGANIRTPVASVGVRGGTALFATKSPCGGELVVIEYGVAHVSNSHGAADLMRPGFGVCIYSDGRISEPFLVPADWIAQLNGKLESGPDQTGGADILPDNLEAHRRLGQVRPPNDIGSFSGASGLDDLNLFWAGNAIVQSGAGVDNQPLPIPPANEPPPAPTSTPTAAPTTPPPTAPPPPRTITNVNPNR
jgi:hypothetical protein